MFTLKVPGKAPLLLHSDTLSLPPNFGQLDLVKPIPVSINQSYYNLVAIFTKHDVGNSHIASKNGSSNSHGLYQWTFITKLAALCYVASDLLT